MNEMMKWKHFVKDRYRQYCYLKPQLMSFVLQCAINYTLGAPIMLAGFSSYRCY